MTSLDFRLPLRPRGRTVLSVVLLTLAAGCSVNSTDGPGVAANTPVSGNPAPRVASTSGPGAAGAAQRVYVDPATGAFVEPPADDTAAKVATSSTATAKSWTTPDGVTLVKIPSAAQSVCATQPVGDAPAGAITVADCQPAARQPAKAGRP